MKFSMGLPAYLGALFIVGLPAAVTGIVTAIAKQYLEGWAVLVVAILTFVAALAAWVVAIYLIEERRDRIKAKAGSPAEIPPYSGTREPE